MPSRRFVGLAMAYPKHGLIHHPIYHAWHHMKSRCNCPTNPAYKNYGGRGIKICSEWNDAVVPFYEWSMANGWEPGLTIDRIDVNGNYCPENCRWTDYKTQARNKRNNRILVYKGEAKTVAEWCEELNLPRSAVEKRLDKYGYDVEKALSKDWTIKQYEFNGEKHSLNEWSKIAGLKYQTLWRRINRSGYTFEEAITMPVKRKKQIGG